jgi:signal transduction histidine kinase
MLSCSNQLRLLIGQVLDLAKVESGKMTFMYEPVSLTSLVQEVIGTLQTIAKSKQIEVAFTRDPQIDSIMADAGRLKQILYNYLSNALKFTPQNGHVAVTVTPEGADCYRIAVSDTGIGIAPEDIPRLFSEFGQLGNAETSKSGSGLGLAISKNIAEAQGGSVGVTSEVGRGSTFIVILPRDPKVRVEGEAPGAATTAEPSPSSTTPVLQ